MKAPLRRALFLAGAALVARPSLPPASAEDASGPAAPPAKEAPSMTSEQWHALWDYGDPAGAEKRFREALEKAERAEDRALAVVLRTQVARAQGLRWGRGGGSTSGRRSSTSPRRTRSPRRRACGRGSR